MSDEYETIQIETAEPTFGVQVGIQSLRVHPRSKCEGRDIPCCIHSPSDHHMVYFPLNWRADTQVMERICPHRVGHPDPDHMAYVNSLTPPHECIREQVSQRRTKDPLADGFYLSQEEDCPYPHMEWQRSHGCDGCCRP